MQPLLRIGLLRVDDRLRRVPDRQRECLCRQPERGGDARQPRHADRSRHGLALSSAQRRREQGSVPAHAAGGIFRRRACPAGAHRHGVGEHQPARSGDLSHSPCESPQHRRPLVRLSDVHLRAPDRGCAREHHPFHLHARVRRPAAVLRLAARASRRRRPAAASVAAADRVFAPQPELYRPLQTQADPARRRGARGGLG
ncbi:MAG: hypothetical protein FAZ92_02357 [Accumulibacter sp.]|nr:MAG: hypothetical protein FAZ92_02357 [Accumulibacter sp.]